MTYIWHDYIHFAMQELHPNCSPLFDYTWIMLENSSEPVMQYWNEDKLGILDMQIIIDKCNEIANRKIVPKEVSKAQALQALYNAGLYDSVISTIKDYPVMTVKIWFDNANVWERNHPYIQMFGPEFNLTDDQIDDLFIAASKL